MTYLFLSMDYSLGTSNDVLPWGEDMDKSSSEGLSSLQDRSGSLP